jgi:hypothetical protein
MKSPSERSGKCKVINLGGMFCKIDGDIVGRTKLLDTPTRYPWDTKWPLQDSRLRQASLAPLVCDCGGCMETQGSAPGMDVPAARTLLILQCTDVRSPKRLLAALFGLML